MAKNSKKKNKKLVIKQRSSERPAKKLGLKPKRKKIAKKINPGKKITSRKSAEPKAMKVLVAEEPIKKTKIRIIGIGGGGGTIVSEIAARIQKASFVVANTDNQALKAINSKVIKFPFGQNLTQGLGTGMNAVLGQEAAEQEKEKIEKILDGHDLTIFVVALGGGTGSGAAPIFAKLSRSLGNLNYGIFTLPFNFEGEKKMEIALDSLKKIRPYLNAFSVIPNERVFQVIDKNTPLKEALSAVNKILTDSLEGLIETIYEPGLINIDFADFKTILEGQGRLSYLNTLSASKDENSRQDLINKIISSPLYPYGIRGAKSVLFDIAGEKDLELAEVSRISKTISDLVSKDAKIIFGISQGKKTAGSIRITLLATGCQLKNFQPETEKPKAKIVRIVKKEESKEEGAPKKIEAAAEKKTAPKSAKRSASASVMASKQKKILFKREKVSKIIAPETEKVMESTAEQQERTRKNAMQLKSDIEAEEREIEAREQIWDIPAFLRQKKT